MATNISITTSSSMMSESPDVNMHDHGAMAGDSETMATAKKMHWVSSVIIGIICMVIGLVGNTLSMIIWRRKSVRSSTGNYLTALAVADSGLLLFFFLVDSLTMIDPSIKERYAYGVFYSYVGYPVFFFFVVSSIWLTVGVTVDRYIQVCWIRAAKDFCNEKRALSGIFIILFLCFIVNIPHFNTYAPVSGENATAAFAFTEFGAGEGSKNYEFWVHCMFLVLVPFSTILLLNLFIIRQVLKMNKTMEDKKSLEAKSKSKKQEQQMTRLLLVVTFTFLFLIALQCVTQCFFMLKPDNMNYQLISEAFAIAKLGIIINSSINFFLYCVSGKRFRRELRRFLAEVCCLGMFSAEGLHSDTSFTGSSKETPSTVMSHTGSQKHAENTKL